MNHFPVFELDKYCALQWKKWTSGDFYIFYTLCVLGTIRDGYLEHPVLVNGCMVCDLHYCQTSLQLGSHIWIEESLTSQSCDTCNIIDC